MTDQISDLRPQTSGKTRPRVLALSSGGGHWVQLLRLRPAFKDCDITYATVSKGYESEVVGDPEQSRRVSDPEQSRREGAKFRTIIDSNLDEKPRLLVTFINVFWTIIRIWPDTIISTGAAPGFFAIFIGKLLGKKTIWVDSIANAEELSMSGQKAGKYVTHWLTQWEHLAKPDGPHYFGNVLGDPSEKQSSEATIEQNEKSPISHRPCVASTRSTGSQISNLSKGTLHSSKSDAGQSSDLGTQKSFRIFVTVGTDQHFDRMVKIIDQWAANNTNQEIFAQIGETDYQPSHLNYSKFLTPQEFVERVKSASLIIGHAGMGTILTALKHQKPILVMPKLANLGEHRNEHQTATAKYLSEQGKVNVASDEHELVAELDHLKGITANNSVGPFASNSLTIKLSASIRSR